VRIKYTSRAVYFAIQTGLIDEEAYAEKVERERVERLTKYLLNGCLAVESIEEFKEKFGI
jgi:hypothetical protein